MTAIPPTEVQTIRCSALPRIMACPASAKAPDILIDTTSDDAKIGSAAHAVMAKIVREGLDHVPDLEPFAQEYGVKVGDFDFLCYAGVRILREVQQEAGGNLRLVGVEHEVRGYIAGFEIVGHPDFIWEDMRDGSYVIPDIKTEQNERDHWDQLVGYDFGVNSAFGQGEEPKADTLMVWWLRSGDYETRRIVTIREEVGEKLEFYIVRSDWIERFTEAANSSKFCPGEHCEFCPWQFDCPAKDKLTQAATTTMVALDDPYALAPAKLAELWPKRCLLKKVLGQYDDAVKASNRKSGPLELGDGRIVGLQTISPQTIHFDKAKELLEPFMGDLGDAITVGKGKLEEVVKASVEKGKGRAWMALMESLEEKGAITENPYDKLTVTKRKEKEDE